MEQVCKACHGGRRRDTLFDFESYKSEVLSLKSEFINEVFASTLSDYEKEKVATIGLEALKGEDISL